MGRLSVNGIEVEFEDRGGGKQTPLLLIHGHPFNRSMWNGQLGPMTDSGRRVIAPDLRGYGRSSTTPGTTPLGVFATDLKLLLDAVGVFRPVVVCGLSMGGQIAMEFCRLFPESVAGVVLVATFPQAETEEGKRSRHAMADRLLREGMRRYAEEVLSKMLAPRTIATRPDIAGYVLDMMCPGLIVVGDRDAFTTRREAERMHTLIKRSELVWMDGVGHMPNLENEAGFNTALASFLRIVDENSRLALEG
jgi:pimeloyl-ACP methyl ester carboxylesterase